VETNLNEKPLADQEKQSGPPLEQAASVTTASTGRNAAFRGEGKLSIKFADTTRRSK
jgi:hypothetical protein